MESPRGMCWSWMNLLMRRTPFVIRFSTGRLDRHASSLALVQPAALHGVKTNASPLCLASNRSVGLGFEFFRQLVQPCSQPRRFDLPQGLAGHSGAATIFSAASPGKHQHVPAVDLVVETVEA